MAKLMELAELTSSELRLELKQAFQADATEISGIWQVPCRHCHGANHQYQYTDPEWYYVEQAYAAGENGWPYAAIVTSEYNPVVRNHASAAYLIGKEGKTLDTKGGGGYSRNAPINPDCPQCSGRGEAMLYFADTRRLSAGAKRLFKGVKLKQGGDIEIMTVDRQHIRDMLARDLRVGIERKQIDFNFPRSPEEFDQFLDRLPARDLEMMLANMIELDEGNGYKVEQDQTEPVVTEAALPKPSRFTRGK
jgi:hypothetical protein